MFLRFSIIILLVVCNSCASGDEKLPDEYLLGDDYRLFQNTPAWGLAKAVENGDTTKIKEELSRNPLLIDFQEPVYGNTLLMMTILCQKKYDFLPMSFLMKSTLAPVRRSQLRSFRHLLDNGANPNLKDSYKGSTALMIACLNRENDTVFIKELLRHGADPNIVEDSALSVKNGGKGTALHYACESNLDFVDILIRNGADTNIPVNGRTIMSLLIESHNYDAYKYLIKKMEDYKTK